MLLWACTPEPPPEETTIVDASPWESAGDYFPMHLQPEFALVAASFGYDALADQARSVTVGDQLEHPGLLFVLYDRDWNGSLADTDNACLAALFTDGAPRGRAAWVASFPDQLFGFDFGEFTQLRDACEGEVDPSRYPDVAPTMANLTWSVSVAAEMNDEYFQRLIRAGVAASELDNSIGGGFHGDLGATLSPTGLLPDVLTTGFETDESHVTTQPLREATKSEMVLEGALQRAYYSIQVNMPINALAPFF